MDVAMTDESAKPAKKRNERTCAGCGKHADAGSLVRVILDESSGEVAVDLAGSAFGHGAHVHGAPDCLARALKNGFSRSFKAKVAGDARALGAEIVRAAERRIEGLLTGARRAGQLAVGGDAVVDALKSERASLVVVAKDAAAAVRLPEVERAVAAGKAVVFADKPRLGALMKRDETAVIAVLNLGVASAILQTDRVSAPFRSAVTNGNQSPAAAGAGSEEAWSSSEVR